MYARSIIRSAMLSALVAVSASAQSATPTDTSKTSGSDVLRRSAASIAVVQSRPQGAFAERVGLGYGVNGTYLFRLDDAGVLSLRADVGIMSYGNESRRSMLSESVGDRVQVEVETSNYIVPVMLGAQLTWPSGAVHPYVNVGAGGQAFFTESSVRGTNAGFAFASTTNHSAWAPAWAIGGGVAMPVYTGKASVQLDLGAQYVAGGRARYLTEGSIVDLPGGAISVTPAESATHLVVVRVGARISR
jgi:opacity protein-like surface antigen